MLVSSVNHTTEPHDLLVNTATEHNLSGPSETHQPQATSSLFFTDSREHIRPSCTGSSLTALQAAFHTLATTLSGSLGQRVPRSQHLRQLNTNMPPVRFLPTDALSCQTHPMTPQTETGEGGRGGRAATRTPSLFPFPPSRES